MRSDAIPLRSGLGLGLIAFAVFILTAIPGCGDGKKAVTDTVTGKVTLGADIVSGTVVFLGSDKKEISVPIGLDGMYTVPNPPKGQVKIAVKQHVGIPNTALPTTGPAPSGVSILKSEGPKTVSPPAQYADPEKSGLSYEVKGGKETHNIELKK